MSDFLDILTHGRRLQGAVKELSIEELEQVQEKLSGIIEKRKEKLVEQIKTWHADKNLSTADINYIINQVQTIVECQIAY